MLQSKEKEITLNVVGGDGKAAEYVGTLENGFILGVEVYTNNRDFNNPTTLSIADDDGVTISKAIVDHYKRREGAGFYDSFKPLMLMTNGKTFKIKVEQDQDNGNNYYYRVVFIYRLTDQKC
jgi:hypothetical protein